MSRGRGQQGARYLASEQDPSQDQPQRKRRVIVNTGAYGNRVVPAKTTLADAAAAHEGCPDSEVFVAHLLAFLSPAGI